MLANKKIRLLVTGVLFMLFICYQFGIKKTIATSKAYYDNLEKYEKVSAIPQQVRKLSQKEHWINAQLAQLNLGDGTLQNQFLDFLNQKSAMHNVNVLKFDLPHTVETDANSIETFIFELEGSYGDMLQVLNSIENNAGFGAVTHVHFEKDRKRKSRRSYLKAQVFLEQLH
ncbi:hypothetical protein ABV409_14915 [Flagellimonas sp. DF-77]|uniref:hypothetical protein n=1 Tax=Flagellimonas algarum TaxID=3230298 RepID=UPI0033931761